MESNPPSIYALAWIDKIKKKKEELEKFRQKLFELAKQLGIILKREYNATAVYLIGSIASDRMITFDSDIDLVVKGLPEKDYFSILTKLYEFLPSGVQLDLITFESADETMQKRAIHEGILL
jgi:predicted nucleotidyltransferase